jgi:aminopeptidase N
MINFSEGVQGALLPREPQYAPDQPFETLHIEIELEFELARQRAAGSCRTVLRAFAPIDSVELDAAEMKVTGVEDAEGRALRFEHKDGKLKVRLRRKLEASEETEIVVHYVIEKPRVGLHFVPAGSKDAVYPQVWSHAEPQDARYWFPCHDNPHSRVTSEARLTVPKGYTAVSNGVLVSKEEKGGKAVFHWRMNRPHATYLISVAVGRFSVVEDKWEDIPVLYYCEKGREEEAKRGFAKTPKALAFFSEKIGVRYPYEQYSQVAVSEFPGGMEHTTCTTQTDAALLDSRAALDLDYDYLVAHELAHQWFGDLLTCRDWAHAWLNEGFATYFEVLFCEHDKGQDEALYELLQNARNYFHEDKDRYRRPIVTARYRSPWVLFDRHLYEKGACVLHLIRHLLGEEGWWKSIHHYVRSHQDKTVVTDDLIRSIREATGRNLQPVFDQWVFKGGYPHFAVRYRYEDGKAHVTVSQTQRGDDVALFTLPVELRFVGRGYDKTFKENLSKREHRFSYSLPSEPLAVEFDPDRWILKKIEFKKPFRLWENQLKLAKNSRGRMEAAESLAQWGDEKSVRLIEEAFKREKFWGAKSEFVSALGRIGTPAAQKALERLLAEKHPKVRRAVVEALSGLNRPELASRWERLLKSDPSYFVRASAARALGRLRDHQLAAKIRPLLNEPSWRDVLRASAVDAYASARLPEAEAMLKRHAGPAFQFATRAAAIRALGDFSQRDPGVVDLLIKVAETDRDERMVTAAVRALGQTEDVRAERVLERLEKESPSERVRVGAAEALVKIRRGFEASDGGKKGK